MAGRSTLQKRRVLFSWFFSEIFDAIWFVSFVGAIELVEALHETNAIPVLIRLY